MILALLIPAGGIAVMLALGWGLVVAGLRAGDRAGDATVSAVMDTGQLAVVAVGQTGGRLRVFRVPVISEGIAGAGRPARAARAGDRG